MLRASRTLVVIAAGLALMLAALVGRAPARATAAPERGPGGVASTANSWSGSFSPSPVDFGTVAVGTTTTLQVAFNNDSNEAFPIYSVGGQAAADGSPFDITNARDQCRSASIAPTQACTFSISFTPLLPSTVTLALTFFDNNFVAWSVNLTGTGVVAAPVALTAQDATGTYTGTTVLSATLSGCGGDPSGHAVTFTIITPAGSRTVSATTDASGTATTTGVPLTVETGGGTTPIPAGIYSPIDETVFAIAVATSQGITADFAGDATCASASGTATLTVTPKSPVLTFADPGVKTIGDAAFAPAITSTADADPSPPQVTLTYDTPDVCTGDVNIPATVTILSAGTCTITARQPANDDPNYSDAEPVERTFAIARATPSIAWVTPAAITYGTALSAAQLNATAMFAGNAVPGKLTYTPDSGTVLNAGTQTLQVNFEPTDATNYSNASGTVQLVINQAVPTITWATPASITYGTALSGTQLNATASFGGEPVAGIFSYEPAAATVLAAGQRTLAVTFTPGDTTNYAGASTTVQLAVERAALTITAKDASRAYGLPNPAFTADYSGFVNGEGPGTLAGTLLCSSEALPASPIASSPYPITCTGRTSGNYAIAYVAGRLTITGTGSTTTPADATVTYGAATVTLTATVEVNHEVGTTVAGPPINDGHVTFIVIQGQQAFATGISSTVADGQASAAIPLTAAFNAGMYTITATYSGGTGVEPSTGTATLTIDKADQTIAFAVTDHPLSDSPITVSATATSGLVVGFAASGNCTIDGNTVTLSAAGSCTITASQGGNGNYNPAPDNVQSFQITSASEPNPSPGASPSPSPSPGPSAVPSPLPSPSPSPSLSPSPSPIPSPSPSPAPGATLYTLYLTITGSGAATPDVPGPQYPAGTVVRLSAMSAVGQVFTGWTVDGQFQGWNPAIGITMRADRRVVATFAPLVTFCDVGVLPPRDTAISQLATRGFLKGYDDGCFRPDSTVKRAEIAAMIVRTMGWGSQVSVATPFSDQGEVDNELWRAIGILTAKGIAQGFGDGSFRPGDPVLHAQAISLIARSFEVSTWWLPVPDDLALYKAIPPDSGHREDVATYVSYAGTIPGTTRDSPWDGPMGWDQPATRGWVAMALWQALDSYWGKGRVE